MGMHHKKTSWQEEIDPAFSRVIRTYIAAFRKIVLPSEAGYLCAALDDKEFSKMDRDEFPCFVSFYENDQAEDILHNTALSAADDFTAEKHQKSGKETEKKKDYARLIMSMAQELEQPSREYYLRAFSRFVPGEHHKDHKPAMTAEEKKKESLELQGDIRSLLWHCEILNMRPLRKDAHIRSAMEGVARRKRSPDRVLFFACDTLSLLAHRKPLKQLLIEAKSGNDDSLFKLMKVDKTVFDHDWVRAKIRKALYSGDDDFFASLGDAVSKKPLNVPYDDLEIAIVLIQFWDAGLNRLTVHQARQLLLDSGITFLRGDCSFNHVRVRLRPFLQSR